MQKIVDDFFNVILESNGIILRFLFALLLIYLQLCVNADPNKWCSLQKHVKNTAHNNNMFLIQSQLITLVECINKNHSVRWFQSHAFVSYTE